MDLEKRKIIADEAWAMDFGTDYDLGTGLDRGMDH